MMGYNRDTLFKQNLLTIKGFYFLFIYFFISFLFPFTRANPWQGSASECEGPGS